LKRRRGWGARSIQVDPDGNRLEDKPEITGKEEMKK
jgi:hypothetical protein